jgi:hypothetical protein
MPSLLKNESNRIKSGKLKPLDDKLAHSRLHEKQKHIEQNAHSNVNKTLFRWSGSMTFPKKSNRESNDRQEVQNVSTN